MIEAIIREGEYSIQPKFVGNLSFIVLYYGDYAIESKLVTDTKSIQKHIDYFKAYIDYLVLKAAIEPIEDIVVTEGELDLTQIAIKEFFNI